MTNEDIVQSDLNTEEDKIEKITSYILEKTYSGEYVWEEFNPKSFSCFPKSKYIRHMCIFKDFFILETTHLIHIELTTSENNSLKNLYNFLVDNFSKKITMNDAIDSLFENIKNENIKKESIKKKKGLVSFFKKIFLK